MSSNPMRPEPSAPKPSRSEIADALARAAELEHSLSCQYLFAAFSLKKHVAEGGVSYVQLVKMQSWGAALLAIARQEMEHLGLVANILSAIGEAPTLFRRNFPVPASELPIGVPLELLPFGLPMLRNAILYELPSFGSSEPPPLLSRLIPDWRQHTERTIDHLYAEIAELIAAAGDDIFIGPPDAQVGNAQVFPTKIIGVPVAAIASKAYYSVLVRPVYTAAQALDVIAQIRHEGEGYPSKHNYRGSHFRHVLDMYAELAEALHVDPGFAPARDVVPNPRASLPAAASHVEAPFTALTNPVANQLARLFDRGYQATVLMLMRFYFHNGQNEREIETLARVAFFPMMTTFIRPVGEVLTELAACAGDAHGRRAGPGFDFAPRLAVTPDPAVAWKVIRDELAQVREGIQQLANSREPQLDPGTVARLTMIWQNLAKMVLTFDGLIDPPKRLYPAVPGPTIKPVLAQPTPLLVLQFGGWVLIRLPTDPDPTDELRGVSGYSFAFGDEPDLTREMAFDVPPGFTLRSHSPPIGVYIEKAQRIDKSGVHEVAALSGARFWLLDKPTLENRNWTLTLPGCEPIVPFRMRVVGNQVTLAVEDVLTQGPLWEASELELERRGPPGFAYEPATAAAVTGQWDSLRITRDRYEALQQELATLQREGVPEGRLAITLGRLKQLEFALHNPADRRISGRYIIERFGFVFNQAASVEGDADLLGTLETKPNTWNIAFWIGGWDPDLLVARMQGALTIPYSVVEV